MFAFGELKKLNEAQRCATLRRFEFLEQFIFAAPQAATPAQVRHLFAALFILRHQREPGDDSE